MKRLKLFTLLTFSFAGISMMPMAHAVLDLELTKGMRAAIPIAIVPFSNESQALAPGNQTVSQVVQNDLQNSGEFAVKPLANVPANLRSLGVNDVVKGSITPAGGDRYQVSFQLVGVYNQDQALVADSFTVPKSALRKVSHRISDMIFEKLTGVRGVFSTKVAYVLVERQVKPIRYVLEVSDMDGFDPRPLLTSPQPIMSPAWSPSGRQLAYVSFEGEHAAIYIQDLASGGRDLVARYPGINGAPAFSPDGKKLALVLTLSGNPKIYVMNIGSHKLTQITQGYSIDTEPSWSPDGKSLIFTSSVGSNPQIFRYDFATQQPTRITFDGNYNARASFMPDQQGIVMMHRAGGDGASFGIAREDFNNGRVQVLTQAGADDSPSLAPNGKMVIYASQSDGRGVLGIVSIDGGIKLRLPAREGDVQEPAWSPFLG